MFPKIWIFDTYAIMIIIGVILCFVYLNYYAKKTGLLNKTLVLEIEINACFSIATGIIFALLFQNLYYFIENPSNFQFTFSLTFYGGLIGGVIAFLLIYFLYQRKKYGPFLFNKVLPIASSMICIAHGLGRVGCFFNGCCYGKETTSPLGVTFPGHDHAVYPTQLYEAIFLIVLSIILLVLAVNKKGRYNFSIYMISYGVFRFLLEFIRGDERGAFIMGLTPSQFWSIVLFIGGIILLVITILKRKDKSIKKYS